MVLNNEDSHRDTKVYFYFAIKKVTEVFSDLPGHRFNGKTLPADKMVINGEGSKSYLVVIKRKEKKIIVIEQAH